MQLVIGARHGLGLRPWLSSRWPTNASITESAGSPDLLSFLVASRKLRRHRLGPSFETPSNKVGDAGAQMPVGGHLRRSEGRVGLFRLTPMIGNLGRGQASTLRAISVDTYRASASGSTLRPSST